MNSEELSEQKTIAFARKLLSLYFEKRDMEALSHYLGEHTSWIGTGEDELCDSLVEAEAALSAELTEYSGNFTISDIHLTASRPLASIGVAYGKLNAIPSDPTLSNEDVRFSAVLEQTKHGPKVAHVHFSHADSSQELGNFFVKQAARTDNQNLRVELNMRERQLANLTKNIPGGAHQCANDPNMTLLSVSDGFLSMFGYTEEEIEKTFDGKFINMIYPGDRGSMLKATYEQLEVGSDLELEYRVLCKGGQPIWVLDKGRLIDDGSGGQCFYCILIDITQRKQQEEELRLSLERHKIISDQATDIIFEWDIREDTLTFSPNWQKRFGYEAINQNISGQIPLSKNIHADDMLAFIKIMRDTTAGVPYSETEFRIRDLTGIYFWCRIRATTQYSSDGRPIKAVGVIVDIDEEKRRKQQLILKTQYDALTGIYNKETISLLVERHLQNRYNPVEKISGHHALLIIDIDHFKEVNDNHGHLCGDSILSEVAAALKNSIHSSDLVGRVGGDEFLVYLPDIADKKSALHTVQRILDALASIRPKPKTPPITCSIGIAILPRLCGCYQELYQSADNALYQCKNAGRNGFALFNPSAKIEHNYHGHVSEKQVQIPQRDKK